MVGVNLLMLCPLRSEADSAPVPCPRSPQKSGSVASGWPHAPPGDQPSRQVPCLHSPFIFTFPFQPWPRWTSLSTGVWGLGSHPQCECSRCHQQYSCQLYVSGSLTDDGGGHHIQLPYKLLANVMEFGCSKIPPSKAIKSA